MSRSSTSNCLLLLLLAVATAPTVRADEHQEPSIVKQLFGQTSDGKQVDRFTLKNANGLIAEVINYGATLVSLQVPDRHGALDDITLGYENLEGYENDRAYFGATVGRLANRLGGARLTVDGKEYQVAANTLPDFGPNHLHGGVQGFNKVVWEAEELQEEGSVGVRFSYLSKDGEEGYPGNLQCSSVYVLTSENELKISFRATTDQTTVVNMTHHSYFNLAGAGSGDVLNHELTIQADRYTPADDDLIPTGTVESVKGLPVDFTLPRRVGSRILEMQQAKYDGYDNNYVLNHTRQGTLEFAARVFDPKSGRVMEVYTTQPCMHFYTGNFLDGVQGKDDKIYHKNGALCLEPQRYPDAPNQSQFPSVVLRPGEEYSDEIVYKFPRLKTK